MLIMATYSQASDIPLAYKRDSVCGVSFYGSSPDDLANNHVSWTNARAPKCGEKPCPALTNPTKVYAVIETQQEYQLQSLCTNAVYDTPYEIITDPKNPENKKEK